MQPIIVGIDPGTTSAFAALSFDFKVLKVKSKKNYSLAGLIYDIYKVGYPIIIATDKKEVPSFIKEFSQKTGSKIYNPNYDTKKGEKQYIVKEKRLLDYCNNTHETDALASAIYAYREYLPLIKKIDSLLNEKNKNEIRDKVIMKVILEEKNIYKVINELENFDVKNKKQEEKQEFVKPINKIFENELNKEEKEIFLLKKTIDRLREELDNIKIENALLKEKKIDISDKIKKLINYKEKRAIYLIKENKYLKKKLEEKDSKIKKLYNFIFKTKNSILIKKLKNLSFEEYEKNKDLIKIEKDDVLFIENLNIFSENLLKELKEKVKAIIIDGEINNTKNSKIINVIKKDFVIIESNNLEFEEMELFLLTNKNKFEEIYKNALKEKNKKDIFLDILDEYKFERKKELFSKK